MKLLNSLTERFSNPTSFFLFVSPLLAVAALVISVKAAKVVFSPHDAATVTYQHPTTYQSLRTILGQSGFDTALLEKRELDDETLLTFELIPKGAVAMAAQSSISDDALHAACKILAERITQLGLVTVKPLKSDQLRQPDGQTHTTVTVHVRPKS